MTEPDRDLQYLKEYLTCAICLHLYQDPRKLPCGHSFCLECLTRHIQETRSNNTFKCATCRITVNIQETYRERTYGNPSCTFNVQQFAKSFPQNVLLEDVGERVREVSDSHFCDSHIGVHVRYVCITDLALLCEECAITTHRKQPCQVVKGSRANEYLTPQIISIKNDVDKKIKDLEDEKEKRLETIKKNTLTEIDNFLIEIEQTFEKVYEDAKEVKRKVENVVLPARYENDVSVLLTDLKERKKKLDRLNEPNQSSDFGKTIKEMKELKSKLLQTHPIAEFSDSIFVKNAKTEAVMNEYKNKVNLIGDVTLNEASRNISRPQQPTLNPNQDSVTLPSLHQCRNNQRGLGSSMNAPFQRTNNTPRQRRHETTDLSIPIPSPQRRHVITDPSITIPSPQRRHVTTDPSITIPSPQLDSRPNSLLSGPISQASSNPSHTGTSSPSDSESSDNGSINSPLISDSSC